MENFRRDVTKVGHKALAVVEKFIDGKEESSDRAQQAIRMVGLGVKVEHMDQVKELQTKSFSLRLAKLLPVDNETREKYIGLTNPEVRPLLKTRPEKK